MAAQKTQFRRGECRLFPGIADPPCPRVLEVRKPPRGMGGHIGGVLSGIQQAMSH
jgi:hypothetical protein